MLSVRHKKERIRRLFPGPASLGCHRHLSSRQRPEKARPTVLRTARADPPRMRADFPVPASVGAFGYLTLPRSLESSTDDSSWGPAERHRPPPSFFCCAGRTGFTCFSNVCAPPRGFPLHVTRNTVPAAGLCRHFIPCPPWRVCLRFSILSPTAPSTWHGKPFLRKKDDPKVIDVARRRSDSGRHVKAACRQGP